VEETDIGGAVAHHADSDGVILHVDVGQRQAGGNRNVRADDGVPAPEEFFGVGEVHRATFAFGNAGGLSQQFGHNRAGRNADIVGHAVIAVSGNDVIVRPAGRYQAGADRLLPDVEVQKTTNFSCLIQLR